MRKRVIVLLLSSCVSLSLLTACGDGGSDESTSAEQTSEDVNYDEETNSDETGTGDSSEGAEDFTMDEASEAESLAEETLEETSSDMCSDADFAALQSAYTSLCQQYELINEYCEANIELDETSKEGLAYIKGRIDEYANLDQASLTTDDAIADAQDMANMATALNELATDLVQ